MASYIKQVNESIFYKFCSIVLMFFTTRYLLKILSLSNYGEWALIFSLLSAASMFNFGLASIIHNVVAEKKNNWEEDFSTLTTYNFFISILSGLVVLFVYYFFFDSWLEGGIFSLIFSMLIINSAQIKYFVGTGRAQINELYNFVVPLGFFLQLYFASFFEVKVNVTFLLSTYFVSQLTCVLISFFYIKREISLCFRTSIEEKLKLSILRIGLLFFLVQVSSYLLYSTGRVVTNAILDSESVAKFDLIAKLGMPILILGAIAYRPLWTCFSKTDNYEEVRKHLVSAERFILFFFTVSIVCGLASPFVIESFFGVSNISLLTTLLYSFSMFIQVSSQPYCYYLNSRSMLKGQLLFVLLGVSILVTSSWILTNLYGLNGIMISIILAYLPFLLFSFYTVKKDIRNGLLAVDK